MYGTSLSLPANNSLLVHCRSNLSMIRVERLMSRAIRYLYQLLHHVVAFNVAHFPRLYHA